MLLVTGIRIVLTHNLFPILAEQSLQQAFNIICGFWNILEIPHGKGNLKNCLLLSLKLYIYKCKYVWTCVQVHWISSGHPVPPHDIMSSLGFLHIWGLRDLNDPFQCIILV